MATFEKMPAKWEVVEESVFRVSHVLGVFPFSEQELRVCYRSVLQTLGYTGMGLFGFLPFFFQLPADIFTVTLVLSSASNVFIPCISVFWLLCNKKKFKKLILALQKVEMVLPRNRSRGKQIVFYFSIIFHIYIFAIVFINFDYGSSMGYSMGNIFMFLVVLTMHQFVSVVKQFRDHGSYLVETLDASNAQKYSKCHEVLSSCREVTAHCYAPQLLFFTFSTLALLVCLGFQLSATDVSNTYSTLHTQWVLHAAMHYFYLLYNCRQSLLQSREFDKCLYHLVIKDETKTLVRNKRIQIHFKRKRQEGFSALGFFNLDYPLICSMVSSTTTYIVILLQFSVVSTSQHSHGHNNTTA